MRINITSVLVDDQAKAERFYTDVLGFVVKDDVPLGEYRWLTVVSPDDPDGTELLLEPDAHPAAKPYKAALVSDGIPCTSFAVDDVAAEAARLKGLGVRFTMEPTADGPGDDRGARRHLRQPDPDRPASLGLCGLRDRGRDHVADQLHVGLPVDRHLDRLLVDLVVGQPRPELVEDAVPQGAMRMWLVRTETPKTYWPSSLTIGWFQAMTTSAFRYFEVMALRIARTVAPLVSSTGAR